MDASELTLEEELEAQRIADIVSARARAEALEMGRLLASKKNKDLLGQTEFTIRESVHRIGAVAIETDLEERKKRGTKDRASSARSVPVMPASKATIPKR